MPPVERDGAWLADVAHATGQALVVVDLDGRVTFWNAAAERLHGWDSSEVLGVDGGGPLHELTGGPATARHRARLEQGEASVEVREVRHRDGRVQWVSVVATPLRDRAGAIVGVVQAHTDVTEARRAAERSRVEASHRAAIAGVSRVALDGAPRDELVEVALADIASELDVPMVDLFEVVDDGDALLLRAGVGWRDGLVGSVAIPATPDLQPGFALSREHEVVVHDRSVERGFRLPDHHTEAGVVASMSTTLRGRGARVGVLGAHAAVPRSFSGEDADYLHAIGRILGAAIARDAVDQELGATIERLERSEEIRVAFLRATSHELRTPLTVISGVAETLERHQERLDPAARRDLLDRLTTNTRRLDRLIGDLLDVDRLASGLVVAQRRAHDLRALVERVVDESAWDTHRIRRDLVSVTVTVDVPKFERVVANLVANAVRHTPPGTTVTITLGTREAEALLRVEDDGPGIDPYHLERIFDPFVQGRERHLHAQPGTGLGLALAREIVHLHGGEIHAENRPEGGARFEVTLPTGVLPDAHDPQEPTNGPQPAGG